ncbi:putative ribonuclease H-like domain-containing protein, partial [Tanacetum coccineum]
MNFVPTSVVTKSGQVPVNTAKQSSPRVAASISTARRVNTATPKSKVNDALPKTYSYFKAHSPVRRTFNQKLAAKTNNLNEKVKTARVNNVTTTGSKAVAAVGNGENAVKRTHRSRDLRTLDAQAYDRNKVILTDYKRLLVALCILQEVLKKFCGMKGIKREFSVSRTPQQNGVAERKNRTLIEAARTMLVDSLLPTTFWAEVVNTVSISFMRPFRCLVAILNTLDPLGKFDGKANEGFLVGYFINSNAFRVFNTRTRKVEENLHITFLENKPNVAGSGPDWLFDIDLLTNSMNYEPVTAWNQTNRNAGIKDNVDAVPTQEYILLPLLYDSPQSSEDAVADNAGKKTNKEPTNEGKRNGYANSTNRVSTISPSVSADGKSFVNDLLTDPLMPDLEDATDLLNTSIFSGAYDDEDEGAEADLNNLETTMNVSHIPTTRIHKDHPKDQIIGDINSATQTRRMTKIS